MFVVQTVAIHPGDRIHVNAEKIIHHRDGFYEPLFIVKRAMRDSHVQHVGQIQPGKEPAGDKIDAAYQHSNPGTKMSWGEIQASQEVKKNNQTADEIVDFQVALRWRYSIRICSRIQITS
jgi:hypothetical protein